jgi:pilus assembly protein CpaB
MLLVALALGLITAYVGWNIVVSNRQQAEGPKTAKILVARRDLDPGTAIEAADIEAASWPAESAPKGTFTNVKDLIGRTVVSLVAMNAPVLDGSLAPAGSPPGLQALVPEGMRAVTLEVNESSGVAGLLVQGARVDVISTLRRGDQTVARTIVENVKVTAVGSRLVRDPRESGENAVRTVTLVMSPKNAEAIELASTNGRPRLVLRGTADNSPTASPGVSLEELVGGVIPAPSNTNNPVPDAFGPAQLPVTDDGFGFVPPVPTTKPAAEQAKTDEKKDDNNGFVRRPVQIIRGGAEGTIYYEMRVPPPPPQPSKNPQGK